MTLLRPLNAYSFFIAICFFSCSKTAERESLSLGDAERIAIDGSKVEKESDISDWIKEIRVFPLGEVEGSMLGDVQKVLLTDKHLFVFDKIETSKIVVFDRKGNFIKELDIVGDGPFPLRQITDCWLNDQDNLEVYDMSSGKVLIFNGNWEVQSTVSAPESAGFLRVMNIPESTGYVAFAGYNGQSGTPAKMAFLDNDLAVQKTVLPFDRALMGASMSVPVNPLFRIGDTLRFYQDFDPRIYTVNPEGKLDIRYHLDYVHRPLPEEFEQELILDNLELFIDEESSYEDRKAVFHGYTGFRGQWMESEDYAVFYSFDEDYDPFTSIYHKRDKQIVAQGMDLREDKRYHLAVPTHFQAADMEDNRFVMVLPGYWLAMYLLPESPFYELVHQDPETLFVVEVDLK